MLTADPVNAIRTFFRSDEVDIFILAFAGFALNPKLDKGEVGIFVLALAGRSSLPSHPGM